MGNRFGWHSGAVKAKSVTAESVVVTSITSAEGNKIYFGGLTTRADVLAATTGAEVGSMYFSSAGKAYVKVAEAGAATDWQKVTSSAAD